MSNNTHHMKNPGASGTSVSVIGLGLMGEALASTFLRAGHPTTVWNRTAAKAESLVAQGASMAASVPDAVSSSPLVVICVSDYDAVHTIIDPLDRNLGGRVVVNLSSGTPKEAREIADWAAKIGMDYLDGAILAVPLGIGRDDAAILYSGSKSAFDSHASTLRTLAGGTTYVGSDHGLAALHDVAVLGLMWNILNAFLHGAAMLGTAGVDAVRFAPIAENGIMTVASWLAGYADQIDRGDFPADDSTIDTHVAAMAHVVDESERIGISAELPRFVKALADRAVAAGRGGDGYASMIDQFRSPAER